MQRRQLDTEDAINLFVLAIRVDLSADKLRQFGPAYPSEEPTSAT